jgi:hypothetical protein
MHLVGAGMDKTIFYRSPEARDENKPLIKVFGKTGVGSARISGIAFIGVRDTKDTGEDYGVVLSNAMDFRIDHCYFEGFGFAAVMAGDGSQGLVDHAIFVDNFKQGIDNLGYGVAVYGNNEWDEDPEPGSAEAVFVEDNIFIGSRHAIASNAGAKYVFRYNLVQENVVACAVDAHGMGYGSAHGTRFVEIYGNTIEKPKHAWCGIGIRGGDGLIFNNTIQGYRNPILLILEWGTPAHLKTSYPAQDQIRALWVWDNEILDGPDTPQIEPEGAGFIMPNRDYFLRAMPGYTPFAYPHPAIGDSPFDR